jgi:hypothetical protein
MILVKLSDFQTFVKPTRLLPAEEPKIHSQNAPKETYYPSRLEQSNPFYIFELCTSRDFGSGLGDHDAGIMLCLLILRETQFCEEYHQFLIWSTLHKKQLIFLKGHPFSGGFDWYCGIWRCQIGENCGSLDWPWFR